MEYNKSASVARIKQQIHFVCGYRVILDDQLASPYGVKTAALNRAVKMNNLRFPEGPVLQLTSIKYEEYFRSFSAVGRQSEGEPHE